MDAWRRAATADAGVDFRSTPYTQALLQQGAKFPLRSLCAHAALVGLIGDRRDNTQLVHACWGCSSIRGASSAFCVWKRRAGGMLEEQRWRLELQIAKQASGGVDLR